MAAYDILVIALCHVILKYPAAIGKVLKDCTHDIEPLVSTLILQSIILHPCLSDSPFDIFLVIKKCFRSGRSTAVQTPARRGVEERALMSPSAGASTAFQIPQWFYGRFFFQFFHSWLFLYLFPFSFFLFVFISLFPFFFLFIFLLIFFKCITFSKMMTYFRKIWFFFRKLMNFFTISLPFFNIDERFENLWTFFKILFFFIFLYLFFNLWTFSYFDKLFFNIVEIFQNSWFFF